MSTEPFPLSQCKTITTYEFERLPVDQYVMEPKVDGWRIQIEATPDGVTVWTRTNHDATRKMPKVEHELLQVVRATRGILRLDGEAVFINEDGTPDYNATARCLGSHTETCIAKQAERGSYLKFFVFDVLADEVQDWRELPLNKRKSVLKHAVPESEHVKPIIGNRPSFERHTKNFEQYKEGSVLKQLSSPYAGRRHKSWLKWKEIETVDVRVIEGYKPGQGKFIGLVGAIHFEAADGTQGYCSGMDDDTRVWITDHYEQLIGTVIEIKHYGKLVDGYRHPQFLRIREDKM